MFFVTYFLCTTLVLKMRECIAIILRENSLYSTGKKNLVPYMALKIFVFPNWHSNFSLVPFLALSLDPLANSVKIHCWRSLVDQNTPNLKPHTIARSA